MKIQEDIHIVSATEKLAVSEDVAVVTREYGAVLYGKYYTTYMISYFLQVEVGKDNSVKDVTDLYHPLRFPVSLN